MTRREAYIALNLMDGMGPVRVRNLAAVLGSPEAIFTAAEADLLLAEGVGAELAARIVAQRGAVDPAAEERKAAGLGARLVTPEDAEYPEPLRHIHDPPLALYVKGTLLPKDKHALAIVGTRSPTHYGLGVADKLGYQLAKSGFTVVSGLARGIDTAAHQAALKGGGRTIAYLGSALDTLYPPENAELAERIAESGAIISEYTLGRPSDRTTFPYRNRLVTGCTMGTIVVETNLKGGAMITADLALEQGRSVFAVPGRVDTPTARGCHRLIKQGARLVEDIEDVLQEFDLLVGAETRRAAKKLDVKPDFQLSPEEQAIVRVLWPGERDVDALTREAGLPAAKVASLLIMLEMKKVIRILPGRVVELRAEVRGDD